ncbi:MAG: hypothetical protein M3O25_12465, partial [Actinomycetota bacterium]|nr:hypothetical protein [Actinomycetota bacterium]
MTGAGEIGGVGTGGEVPATPGVPATPEPRPVADRGVRGLLLGSWRGRFGLGVLGLFVFIAIFGNLIAPYDPEASSLELLQPPSSEHLLGTTESGADVLSQLLVGARVSIVVGFSAAIISALIGAAVGLFSG